MSTVCRCRRSFSDQKWIALCVLDMINCFARPSPPPAALLPFYLSNEERGSTVYSLGVQFDQSKKNDNVFPTKWSLVNDSTYTAKSVREDVDDDITTHLSYIYMYIYKIEKARSVRGRMVRTDLVLNRLWQWPRQSFCSYLSFSVAFNQWKGFLKNNGGLKPNLLSIFII